MICLRKYHQYDFLIRNLRSISILIGSRFKDKEALFCFSYTEMYSLLYTVHTCDHFSHHHLECKLIKFTVSAWPHHEAPRTEWWQDECVKTCRLSYALLLQLTRDVRPCLSRQPQLSKSLVLSGMATCWQPSISTSAPSRRPPEEEKRHQSWRVVDRGAT